MSISMPTRRRPAPRRAAPRPLTVAPTPAAEFDRAYWLAHCEGFRVDAAEGRIGFVESIRDGGSAPILSIRAGRLGRHVLSVSAANVAFIVPRAERIWLTSPVQLVGSAAA
ncbi:MAG: hypothetical protein ACXVY6_08265 [Gaiellaceae bacterium]